MAPPRYPEHRRARVAAVTRDHFPRGGAVNRAGRRARGDADVAGRVATPRTIRCPSYWKVVTCQCVLRVLTVAHLVNAGRTALVAHRCAGDIAPLFQGIEGATAPRAHKHPPFRGVQLLDSSHLSEGYELSKAFIVYSGRGVAAFYTGVEEAHERRRDRFKPGSTCSKR